MQYALGTVLGLCFFIVPVWAYRKGLKDGLNLNQGKSIEPIKSPAQIITERKEAKQTKAETDKFMAGFNNIMAYDGTEQEVSK